MSTSPTSQPQSLSSSFSSSAGASTAPSPPSGIHGGLGGLGGPRTSSLPGPAARSLVRRGLDWAPWEDRELVTEINRINPLTCPKGRSVEKWEEVSSALNTRRCLRSGKSCKQRFYRLLREHRRGNLGSLQNSRTAVEAQTAEFVSTMETLSALAQQQSKDPHIRASARERSRRSAQSAQSASSAPSASSSSSSALSALTPPYSSSGQLTGQSPTVEDPSSQPPNKKRKLIDIEEILDGLARESQSWRQRIREMEARDRKWQMELLGEQKKTNAVLEELCLLVREEREASRRERAEIMTLLQKINSEDKNKHEDNNEDNNEQMSGESD